MDKILELFEKYNCPIKRDKVSIAVFLRQHFEDYTNDLVNSLNPEDNPLIGEVMCNQILDRIDFLKDVNVTMEMY